MMNSEPEASAKGRRIGVEGRCFVRVAGLLHTKRQPPAACSDILANKSAAS